MQLAPARHAVRWARATFARIAPIGCWRAVLPGYASVRAANVLRLMQVALTAALVAAVGAEVGLAVSGRNTTLLALFAPPHDALHPFLPVFLGLVLLPCVVALGVLALARVMADAGRLAQRGVLLPAFAVAVYGTLPIAAGVTLFALPAGGVLLALAVVASALAWTTGYRALAGAHAALGAQWVVIGALAALGVLPLMGALLAVFA